MEVVHPAPAYDVWGESISEDEAESLLELPNGRDRLSPAEGAVKIDEELIRLGEKAFYEETFGNEVPLTDVVGVLDGPLTAAAVAKAIVALRGKGTSNLKVALGSDAHIGGRHFREGEVIDTGLDVAKGSVQPLGMVIRLQGTKVMAGITCALCHSTVDENTKMVVHGAPNADLRAGLILALASNSAAFFTHTDIDPRSLSQNAQRSVTSVAGARLTLPDARALEDAVDAILMAWPPGSFDSMTDLVVNPAQIPSSFTWEAYPYSFSGAFMAGPFRGLSVQNNNVHGLNSDPTTEADGAPARFGLDTELFLAVLLQNAANDRYRFDPARHGSAREFFRSVDPTPGRPGMNELVALPSYPRATLVEPTSLWNTKRGEPVWRTINAMSAWQNTLGPPPPAARTDAATLAWGRAIFERAGCAACHSGPALTNHRIIPAPEIGTQPLRAKGMSNTQGAWDDAPRAYAFDQEFPFEQAPRTIPVPVASFDPMQVALAYGWGDSPGGYKVAGLAGLAWTAPYLHDGGVAVGADRDRDLGAAGTIMVGRRPDPANSLTALVDQKLRAAVVAANRGNLDLVRMHVEGIGHDFWVDPSNGYSPDEQAALVGYLLDFQAR
jgi:hypothetical protein